MRRRWILRTLICSTCGDFSALIEEGALNLCPTCQSVAQRPDAPAPKSATVHDDTLWGGAQYVHNLAPEPIWVEKKSEYRRLQKLHGMREKVRHVPVPGSDKSPITTTWDIGLPPGVDPRPFCMLSPEEQVTRRADAAARLGFTVDELAALGRDVVTYPDTPDEYGNLRADYRPLALSPAEADAEIARVTHGRR